MLDCPNCHKDMTLEKYETFFRNNEQEVILCEEYWCPECNTRALKRSHYYLTNEEVKTV